MIEPIGLAELLMVQQIELDRPPRGKYAFYFTVINAFAINYSLVIESNISGKTSVTITENSKKKNFNIIFVISDVTSTDKVILSFKLIKGTDIFILPSAGLVLIDEKSERKSNATFISVNDLNQTFKRTTQTEENHNYTFSNLEIYTKVFGEVYERNKHSLKESINGRNDAFYNMLDLETAKKQLDYVIFQKMLLSKDGNFFKKIFRKLVRFFIVNLYKLITRSERRKSYLAKFYRNYVNVNYLSERK